MDVRRALPLSIPILKRLQGIPDGWKLVGTYDDQVEQICSTTPAVIIRLIGHTIHAALTGEVVDFDQAVNAKIKATMQLNSWNIGGRSDPSSFRENEWKQYVREHDHSWEDLDRAS